MKKIHVFNPDHELALAFGKENYTPPAAGRGMRVCLGLLPAFWAEDGDILLVDDKETAVSTMAELSCWMAQVNILDKSRLMSFSREDWDMVSMVSPWGWNAALRWQLLKAGVPERLLPDSSRIDAIRQLAHRGSSIPILDELVATVPHAIGKRWVAHSMNEVRGLLNELSGGVFKAPWSSSGRGVRFFGKELSPNLEGFVRHVLSNQGSIIIEPAYAKKEDFAMEFMADGEGAAVYMGLSLFETGSGNYIGNVLADEGEKRELLAQYLDGHVFDFLASKLSVILGKWCQGIYYGPLGVDMMLVELGGEIGLHPCVEVNLRRTMGHVALEVSRRTQGKFTLMRIECENGRYALRLY